MITLQLTNDDAAFLQEQITSRVRQIENELVHTDKRALQAEIARDLERLERIHDRVAHAITLAESSVCV